MKEIAKKRKPTVAALLTLVVMGVGQLYNGQLRRAAVFFGLELLGTAVITIFPRAVFSNNGLMALYFGGLIYLGIRIFAVVDAFMGARRVRVVELRRYNRWYVYGTIYLATMIVQLTFESPGKSYYIPSGPMMPTLLAGDYVLIDKDAYRERTPERGDVVVFKLYLDGGSDYVEHLKRVVGLPGDRIQVKGGILHIDEKPVQRTRIDDYDLGDMQRATQFLETLPNGRAHAILERTYTGFADNTRVFSLPKGHFFAMGDNRDRSQDSRFLGSIPTENLVGRAEIVTFWMDGSAPWWQIWRWPWAARFDRIGKGIY